jgi:hypothetical protein
MKNIFFTTNNSYFRIHKIWIYFVIFLQINGLNFAQEDCHPNKLPASNSSQEMNVRLIPSPRAGDKVTVLHLNSSLAIFNGTAVDMIINCSSNRPVMWEFYFDRVRVATVALAALAIQLDTVYA